MYITRTVGDKEVYGWGSFRYLNAYNHIDWTIGPFVREGK